MMCEGDFPEFLLENEVKLLGSVLLAYPNKE